MLLTDIRTAAGQSINDPVLNLGKVVNVPGCRVAGLSGTLGTGDQRIYVSNPEAAFDGWTLSISPEQGLSAKWQGIKANFDFNDSGDSGCQDTDGDGLAGLMKIDASGAQIQTDCLSCNPAYVTVGHASQQDFSTAESITLMNASGDASDLGRWYVTGIDVEQSIPPEQVGDVYQIEMVLTATAN